MNYNECYKLSSFELRQMLKDLNIRGRSSLTTKEDMCKELIKYYNFTTKQVNNPIIPSIDNYLIPPVNNYSMTSINNYPISFINNSLAQPINNSILPINNSLVQPINNNSMPPINSYPIPPINNYPIPPINNYPIPPINNSLAQPINNNSIPSINNYPIPPINNNPILAINNNPIPAVDNSLVQPVGNNSISSINNNPISPINNSLVPPIINSTPVTISNINPEIEEENYVIASDNNGYNEVDVTRLLNIPTNIFDRNILENIIYNASPEIVNKLDGICQINKLTKSICDDESFWSRKLRRDFLPFYNTATANNKKYGLMWRTLYSYKILSYTLQNIPNRYIIKRGGCDSYRGHESLYDNYIIYDIEGKSRPLVNGFLVNVNKYGPYYFIAKLLKIDINGNNLGVPPLNILIKINGHVYKKYNDVILSMINSGQDITFNYIRSAHSRIPNNIQYDKIATYNVCTTSGIKISHPIDMILTTECPRDDKRKELPVPNLLVYVERGWDYGSPNTQKLRCRVLQVNSDFSKMTLQVIGIENAYESPLQCYYQSDKYNYIEERYRNKWITMIGNPSVRWIVVFSHDCK